MMIETFCFEETTTHATRPIMETLLSKIINSMKAINKGINIVEYSREA